MSPHFTLTVLLLSSLAAAAADGVVRLTTQRRGRSLARSADISKRAGPLNVPVGNAVYLYYINVTVGTPPQSLQLAIDTGSSDVWMSATSAGYCQESPYNCLGGTFTATDSNTYRELTDQPPFQIQYVDGSGSSGNYFTDVLSFQNQQISDLQMGLATRTTVGTGIMGLGFEDNESICSRQAQCQTYPTIVQQLVNQKKINSKAYSLWLDDVEAATGTLLFGGVDTNKYHGDLVALPIQKDSYSQQISSFTVVLTDFTITTERGVLAGIVPDGYEAPVILDSGTSLSLIPVSLARSIFQQVGAQYNDYFQGYLLPCDVGNTDATFNFQFGGSDGPKINVPIQEMVLPISDFQQPGSESSDALDNSCVFGLQPGQQGTPFLLGDTFLRSAYVVYDLDNQMISLAQTNFNATDSNVLPINAGPSGVPRVAGTASAATAENTATASARVGGASVTGSQVSNSVLQQGTSTAPILAGTTTVVVVSTSTGAAVMNVRAGSGSDFTIFTMLGMTTLLVIIGSAMMLF